MNYLLLIYNKFNTWLLTHSSNERQYIFIVIIIIISILYIALIWYPIHQKINSMKEKLASDQMLIIWMNSTGVELIQLRNMASNAKDSHKTSLLALLDQEAKLNPWGAFVTEMKLIENNHVETVFHEIHFDELMSGLEQLWKKYNIQVVKISVQREEAKNSVQSTVVFQL